MSVKIMSAIFESTTLGPTERLIMLALADHADDEGRCYPSVNRLCDRTGLKERAVRKHIRTLEAAGYLIIHLNAGRNGSNLYFVRATPAPDAPLHEMHPAPDAPTPCTKCTSTPARGAPKPSGTIIEPSVPPVSPPPDEIRNCLERWASPDAVTSFIAYRKKHKAKGLTHTAAKRLAKSLCEIFNAGHDPTDALGLAEERGWASVNLNWYENAKGKPHDNRNRNTGSQQSGSGGHGSGTVRAFAEVARDRSQGSASSGSSLPF